MSDCTLIHCAETIKGGIASYLRELLPLQAVCLGSGRIIVVIPHSQRGELPVPPGVKLHLFDDRLGRLGNAIALATEVARLTRRLRPDVVHVHSTFAGAAVRPVLSLPGCGAKVVYCAHGWAWDRPMGRLARRLTVWVERVLARISYRIVCISEHERRSALAVGLPAAKISVVMNGVASQRPSASVPVASWPGGGLRLLYVGRLDLQKGGDVFCAALGRLGERACGIIAGGSVLGDSEKLQMPPNVCSVGWVGQAQLETLFDSADALVMPSRWEGFGLTATEAMRAGLAVIASRVGGLVEVVDDGYSGVLVAPGDAKALAEAISRLDKNGLREMGLNGRSRFERLFQMERVHQELNAVYGFSPVARENAEALADARV